MREDTLKAKIATLEKEFQNGFCEFLTLSPCKFVSLANLQQWSLTLHQKKMFLHWSCGMVHGCI